MKMDNVGDIGGHERPAVETSRLWLASRQHADTKVVSTFLQKELLVDLEGLAARLV